MERKEQCRKQKKSGRGKEEPRSSDRRKWRSRQLDWWKWWETNLWNEAREEGKKAWEDKFRESLVGRDRRKAVERKGRDEKEIEEQENTKREKWRRHVGLPFLAGQVHASILAMPGGKCLVQSRSGIATFRRTVPSFLSKIVLFLLAFSDPSLACGLATYSRRIALCRRLCEPLRFPPSSARNLHLMKIA